MNTTIIGKFCFSAFDYIHLTSTKTLKYWLCVFEYSVFFTSMEMFLHLYFLKCFFISDQLSNRTFTTLFVLILSQLKVKESCFYIFYSSQEEYVLLQELFGFRKCDEDRNEVKWVQVLLVKKCQRILLDIFLIVDQWFIHHLVRELGVAEGFCLFVFLRLLFVFHFCTFLHLV